MDDVTQQEWRTPPDRPRRRSWGRSAALVGGGLVAGGILAGTLGANAATENDTTNGTAGGTASYEQQTENGQPGAPRGNGDPSQPQRPDEQLLTGDTATKVTDAAKAKYPDATIERVETDSDGVYEAHIVTSDGQHVTVKVGKDFTVTGTDTMADHDGDGPRGHGGPGRQDGGAPGQGAQEQGTQQQDEQGGA